MRTHQWYLEAVTLVLTGHGYCTWSKRLQRQAEGSYPLPAQVPVRTALASGTHSDSDQLTDLGILLFRMATTTAIAGRRRLLCQTMPVGGNMFPHNRTVYVE